MQKNKNRHGLALGAVFAMVASLLVTSPAQAADETTAVIYPTTGLATQTTILGTEAFDLSIRFGTGVGASYRDLTSTTAQFGIEVTKPAGVTVSAVVSGVGSGANGVRQANNGINGTSISTTVETAGTSATFVTLVSGSPVVALSLPSRTSVSAAVALTVTPFLDLNGDGDRDSGEPQGTAVTLDFVPWSALGATLTVTQTVEGDQGATASFAVTANAAVNWTQLDGNFVISSSHLHAGATGVTNSANIGGIQLSGATVTSTGSADATGKTDAGNYSASYKVLTFPYTTSGTSSAVVWYDGEILVGSGTVTTENSVTTAVTLSPVTSVNFVQTNDGTADARTNAAFDVRVYPYGDSDTTSVAAVSAFTVSQFANIEFGAQAGVILNGTTYTSSAAFAAAGFAVAANGATIPVSTFGQASTGTIGFSLTSQLKTDELVITVKGTEQVPVFDQTAVAGLAGAAKTFAVTAYDQWGVASARTDQRIAASVKLGSTTSLTVSSAVVDGAASVTVTPTPATGTGSAVVTFTLQTLNQSTQEWENTATRDTASWNVYTYAAGTDAFTSRTVSVSASVSYGVDLSWSETVAIGVLNSFSDVVVSAPGLMIQNADETSVTASDTLTIPANGQTANLKFTSRLVGTYTVTFTSGTATTTSEIVFDAAAADAGATLTFDKNSIAAGETTTITGTLLDMNGNPVMTSGSADVSVAWTGKGLPFGNSTTMETDADGQLTFQVLVLSTEKGDAAISATYKPAGLTVDTDNVTVVHAVAVGKVAASDQKVNAGSFKGYVAVYAKGYEGSRLSAKVGKDWVVVPSIVNNQENGTLFRVTEFTGAGVDIAVRIYIDRVLVDTINLTTK